MADGKKPQKGGKKLEVNTAFEIPNDIYAGYCTPDEPTFGKEDKNQCKDREEMGTEMEGVQICNSKIHEEIRT